MIAKGKVVFDMKYIKGLSIIAVHCKNIEISGITFKGMNGNHYIEVNGAKNVKINKCKFNKAKKGSPQKLMSKKQLTLIWLMK